MQIYYILMAEKILEMSGKTEIVFLFSFSQLLLTSLFNRLTQELHLDKKLSMIF